MAYKHWHYNWFVNKRNQTPIIDLASHLNQPDCICTFPWSSWPSHHLQSLQEITFQESTPWCFITAQFNSHDFRSGGEGEKTFIGFGDQKSFALLTWPNSIYSWCSVLSKQMAWICMCPWEMPNMADQLKTKRQGILYLFPAWIKEFNIQKRHERVNSISLIRWRHIWIFFVHVWVVSIIDPKWGVEEPDRRVRHKSQPEL